jgi:TetR/AcrR family transcriptional regulator, transcriptional repressor of bet genes
MIRIKAEEKKKKEVIIAALAVIADIGFERLTIDAIAKKAKCSHGIINYYFKSKDNLVAESFQYFLEYYYEKIKKEIKLEMNEMDIMKIILKHLLPGKDEIIEKDKDGFSLTYDMKKKLFIQYFSKVQFNLSLEKVFKEIYTKQFSDIALVIKNGIKKGIFKNVSPEITSYTILALITGIANFRLLDILPDGLGDTRDVCGEYLKNILISK